MIDEGLAREYWPNESPLGKRIRFGPPEDNEPWHTVVGVVGAVKDQGLNLTGRKTVYLPYAEVTLNSMTLAVRAANPETLAPAMRGQVKAMDPDQPIIAMRTMTEIISRSVWQPRLYAILFGVFAAVALALASVGIYGVMACSVSERTREIGIRVALGATRRTILRMVLEDGGRMAIVGFAIGLPAALITTRLIGSLLFGVEPWDAAALGAAVIVLATAVTAATLLPAWRATRVNPSVALRERP